MLIGQRPNEKRDYYRMKINSELTYMIPGENRTFRGFCKNLSHTGIHFETAITLKEGQSIEATLSSHDSRFKPMSALVHIIRVEKMDDAPYRVSGKIVAFK